MGGVTQKVVLIWEKAIEKNITVFENKKFENQKLIGWYMAKSEGVYVWVVCEVDQNWACGETSKSLLRSPYLILFALTFLNNKND